MAFPVQDRRLEALIFCGNEIFCYLDENLKLTPQTIFDKTAPIEELEEMHELVSMITDLLGIPLELFGR